MFPRSNLIVFAMVCVSLGTFSPIIQREIVPVQKINYMKQANPVRPNYLAKHRFRTRTPVNVLKNLNSKSLDNGITSVKKIVHANVTLAPPIKSKTVDLKEIVNERVEVPGTDYFAYIVALKKRTKENEIKLKRVKKTKNVHQPPLKQQTNETIAKDAEIREQVFRNITGIDLSNVNLTGLAEKFMNIDLVNIYSNKIKSRKEKKPSYHQNTKFTEKASESRDIIKPLNQHEESPLKQQFKKRKTERDVNVTELFNNITGIKLSKTNTSGFADKFMNVDLINIYSNKIKRKKDKNYYDYPITNVKILDSPSNNMANTQKQREDDEDIEVKNVYKKHRKNDNNEAAKDISLSYIKSIFEGSDKFQSNNRNTNYITIKAFQRSVSTRAPSKHTQKSANSTRKLNNILTHGRKNNKSGRMKSVHKLKSIPSNKIKKYNKNKMVTKNTPKSLKEVFLKVNSPLAQKNKENLDISADLNKDGDFSDLDADDLNDIFDIAKIYAKTNKEFRESLRNFTMNRNEVKFTPERPFAPWRVKPEQFIFPKRITLDKIRLAQILNYMGKNNVTFNKDMSLRPKRHIIENNLKVTTITPVTNVELAKSNDRMSKETLQAVGVRTESLHDTVTRSPDNKSGTYPELFVIPLITIGRKHLKDGLRQKIWRSKPKLSGHFLNNLPEGDKADGLSLKGGLNESEILPGLVRIDNSHDSQLSANVESTTRGPKDTSVRTNSTASMSKDNIYNPELFSTEKEPLAEFPIRKLNGTKLRSKPNSTSSLIAKCQLKDVDFNHQQERLSPLTPHPVHQEINKFNQFIRPIDLHMALQTNVKNLIKKLQGNVLKEGQKCFIFKLQLICDESHVKSMKREIKDGSRNYYDLMERAPDQMEYGFGNLGLKDEMFEQILLRDFDQKKGPRHNKHAKFPITDVVPKQNHRPKQNRRKEQEYKQNSKNGTKPRYTYVRKHGVGSQPHQSQYITDLKKVLWRNRLKNKTINSNSFKGSKFANYNKKMRQKATVLDGIMNDVDDFVIAPYKKEPQKTFKIIRMKYIPLKEVSKLNGLVINDDFMDEDITTKKNMFKDTENDPVYNFKDKLYKLNVFDSRKKYPDHFMNRDFPDTNSLSVNNEQTSKLEKSALIQSQLLGDEFSTLYNKTKAYPSNAMERNDLLPSGRNHKHRSKSQRRKLLKNGLQRAEYPQNESPRSKIDNYDALGSELARHNTKSYEQHDNEIPQSEWELSDLREHLLPERVLKSNSYINSPYARKNVLQSGVLRIPADDRVGNFSRSVDIPEEEDIAPEETPMNMLMGQFFKNQVRNGVIGHGLPMLDHNINVPHAGDTHVEDFVFGNKESLDEKKKNRENSIRTFTRFDGNREDKQVTKNIPMPSPVFFRMDPNKTGLPVIYNTIPDVPYKIYGGQMKFKDNELLNNRHLISLWSTQRHKPREHEIVGGVGPMSIWRHHALHYARPLPLPDYIEDIAERPPEVDYDNEIKRRKKREFKKFRVLCLVLQRSNQKEKIDVIKNTWGKRCDHFVVLSSTIAEQQHPWEYTKSGFQYIHDLHQYDDVHWILKADAMTYVVMENLRHMVENYNPAEAWFFGTSSKSYNTFVLSKGALTKLATQGRGNQMCKAKSDNDISTCLDSLGIQTGLARDEMNRVLFYPFGPLNFDPKTAFDEETCSWSDHAVSFENVSEKDLYTLEYFIYHVRPHAIPWSVIQKLDEQTPGPTTTTERPTTILWEVKHVKSKTSKRHKNRNNIDEGGDNIFETDSFFKDKRRQFKQGLFK